MNTEQKKAKKKPWPIMRQRGNSWMVDTQFVFDTRRRKTFKTLEEAEEYAAEQRKEREEQKAIDKHERQNRAVSLANLNDTQRAEVLEAYRLLNRPRGLVEAVAFYVKHSAPELGSITLGSIYDDYLAAKTTANRRGRTLSNIENQVGPFVYENKDRPAHSITTADTEGYIKQRSKSAVSFNIYRTALLGLFNFAMKRGAVERNVIMPIEKASTDTGIPAILTVKEATALLNKAKQLHPEMVPYLALGLFAGLRPENELRGLDWKNINFKKKSILVTAASAKKRRDRYVEMQPNLAQWLALHKEDEGTIYYSRRKLRDISDKAGVEWKKDFMRHSFGSYHMAHFNDDAKTQKQLGHTKDSSDLFEHYKQLVEPSAAAKYWKIAPDTITGAIIQLPKAM